MLGQVIFVAFDIKLGSLGAVRMPVQEISLSPSCYRLHRFGMHPRESHPRRLPMILNRRSLVAGLAATGTVGIGLRAARAQSFKARQYHPQPAASHLHIYLTKLWDAVRAETDGRLDVSVYAQNNGVPIADPDILKLIQSGELEFFVLNGNILSQAHPVADIQGIPFGGMENGFKHITSVTKPIRDAADLEGFRMRTPGGKIFVEFYKALGAEPKIF